MGVPELNRSQGFSFTKQMPYPLTRQISLNLRPIAFGAQHSCQMPLYHSRLIPTAQQRKVGSIGDERKACHRGGGGRDYVANYLESPLSLANHQSRHVSVTLESMDEN